jgi:hypothetical protein
MMKLLALLISSVLLICCVSAQTFPTGCYLSCQNEINAWSTDVSNNPNDLSLICSQSYVDLVNCFVKSCPGQFTADDEASFKQFEQDCADAGHPIPGGVTIGGVGSATNTGTSSGASSGASTGASRTPSTTPVTGSSSAANLAVNALVIIALLALITMILA